jgi:hypothetical protein
MDLNANRDLITAALARIPKGDRAALQTVYRLTAAKLFGVCLRILGEQGLQFRRRAGKPDDMAHRNREKSRHRSAARDSAKPPDAAY